jgi:hypothetical protein
MSKPFLSLPCKYSLSDFEKQGDRHHCKACDHSLKDFRNATDEEIRQAVAESDGRTCGIFHPSQVSAKTTTFQLGVQRQIGLSLLGILGFVAPIVLSSCDNSAETPINTSMKKLLEDDAFSKLKFPMRISGQLRDEETRLPLPNAAIHVALNDTVIRFAGTDHEGRFEFLLNRTDLVGTDFDLIITRDAFENDTLKQAGKLGPKKLEKLTLTLKAVPQLEINCTEVDGGIGINYPLTGDIMVQPPAMPELPPILPDEPFKKR